MILERTKDEIVVRLPSNIDLTELQNMLDYLEYKELTGESKATTQDAEVLTKEVKRSVWNRAKKQRGFN